MHGVLLWLQQRAQVVAILETTFWSGEGGVRLLQTSPL